jgi:signal transduction histidine kinase/HPt (histidine-containing phosphotransfer) domain-containing protein
MSKKLIAKLLLIEDQPADARLLREMFNEQGAHTTELKYVQSMGEAEQHLAEHAVDIILLDLGLPDAQGVEAVRRAHAAAPNVPLVVLTGLDDESLAAQSLQEGAQDYLIKGQLETRGLMRALRYAVERKIMEVELEQTRDVALESVRLKSEFLANMSHEIRTPMNGVLGMTGLLLETDLSARQQEYTETIQSSAEALLIIIDDILDFSKVESGLMRFEMIDFELRGVVEAPLELLAGRAHAKGLEIASLVYRDVPTALRGDPGRLRQVLTNLIGNAVKFTERGEVLVNVKKVSETVSNVTLRFEIKDTGIGISSKCQRALFQPFTQADGSTTRKYGGTGLGLAISKQLVELMGGEIGIESDADLGSTFWFTGKFEKQLAPTITTEEIDPTSLAGVRALVVDDHGTNRKILVHEMVSWGMDVKETDSAEEALEILRSAHARGVPFAIAILDLMRGEMDGSQLAHLVKVEAALAPVALVLLRSFARRGQGDTARKVGIAAYLQKPVRHSQLYNCLTSVVAESRGSGLSAAQPLATRHSSQERVLKSYKKEAISNTRIIVAEDNVVNQKVALAQLNNLGYHAEVVSNGRELLKALEFDHADLILMDCQMPEMDGFEATTAIRRSEGDVRHTTIIAMTANALDGDAEKCLAAGMDDYLSKPVKSDVLHLMLERWTKTSECGKELRYGSEPQTRAGASGVIDQIQMASLRGIRQPNFVVELINLYLTTASLDLQAMHKALVRGDVSEIRQLAHRLKGSSANIGATQMAALSEALESNDSAQDERKLCALEFEFEQVREALEAERIVRQV